MTARHGSFPSLLLQGSHGVGGGVGRPSWSAETPHRPFHAARNGRFSPRSPKFCYPPLHGQPPAGSRPALTLDGAEAPALVLAVVLGGGAPQVPIFAARAGAAVKPLVIVLEGDGAWFPVGVPLDGVDLCKEGSLALASGPQTLPTPYNPGSQGWTGVSRGRGRRRGSSARQRPKGALCRQVSPGAWERSCCSSHIGQDPQSP